MPNATQHLFNALLRQDLTSFIHRCFQTVNPGRTFVPNWHIEAIAWHLAQCLYGRITRLIISLPPRGLKSIGSSVAFPAWALGHDPSKKIICTSYGENLAAWHARDCRAVMQSRWYQDVFPHTRISSEKNTELEFETTAGGFRLATSVGGTLTGRGGDVIIIDDPLKSADALSDSQREAVAQWYDNTLYSRLDSKERGVIILVMQRLHVDDLVGHVLGKDRWVHLNLPAIAEAPQRIQIGDHEFHERAVGDVLHPEWESRESLERTKTTKGNYNFSAQYQQNPIPPEGNIIKWEWFRRYHARPEKGWRDQIIQSWDTASKPGEGSSYSVCTTWLVKGADYYLLDVVRERLDYPFLKRRVVELAGKFEADVVLIEDMSSGTHLIQDLRHGGNLRPIAVTPEKDKVTRMSVQSPKIEERRVLLPAEAPWLADFEAEVKQFPRGRHDDQIDSMSQFLAWHQSQESDCPSLAVLEEVFRAINGYNDSGISLVKDGKLIRLPRKIGPRWFMPR